MRAGGGGGREAGGQGRQAAGAGHSTGTAYMCPALPWLGCLWAQCWRRVQPGLQAMLTPREAHRSLLSAPRCCFVLLPSLQPLCPSTCQPQQQRRRVRPARVATAATCPLPRPQGCLRAPSWWPSASPTGERLVQCVWLRARLQVRPAAACVLRRPATRTRTRTASVAHPHPPSLPLPASP